MLANVKTFRAAPAVAKRGRFSVRAEGDGGSSDVKDAMAKKGIEEPVRMPQGTEQQSVPSGNMNPGVPQQISETLLPRVDQLKNKQLSEGTSNFTSASSRACPNPAARAPAAKLLAAALPVLPPVSAARRTPAGPTHALQPPACRVHDRCCGTVRSVFRGGVCSIRKRHSRRRGVHGLALCYTFSLVIKHECRLVSAASCL